MLTNLVGISSSQDGYASTRGQQPVLTSYVQALKRDLWAVQKVRNGPYIMTITLGMKKKKKVAAIHLRLPTIQRQLSEEEIPY